MIQCKNDKNDFVPGPAKPRVCPDRTFVNSFISIIHFNCKPPSFDTWYYRVLDKMFY